MKWPDFFIVGAPKSGTTSVYNYLKQHPDIFMPELKTPNFFSYKELDGQKLYYDRNNDIRNENDYLELFENVPVTCMTGEASVSYLFYGSVPERIKKANPDAKIIILLRPPVDRAFSHYMMDKRLGFINEKFEDIVFRGEDVEEFTLFYQQYVRLGFYYNQVKRYVNVFGKDQVHIVFFESIKQDTKKVMSELFKFLSVDTTFVPEFQTHHNRHVISGNFFLNYLYKYDWLRKSARKIMSESFKRYFKKSFMSSDKKPVMVRDVETFLYELYYPDISALSDFLNKDLNHWKKK